jgi:hypothetical protein
MGLGLGPCPVTDFGTSRLSFQLAVPDMVSSSIFVTHIFLNTVCHDSCQ